MKLVPIEDSPAKIKLVPLDEPEQESAPKNTPRSTTGSISEPALTVATSAIAEPISGLAGIAQALNPFVSEGAGARAVEATREALTYQPRTEAGKESLQKVGKLLEPVGKAISGAEKFLGDNVFEATNSPTLAAAAATLPTAILETIGLKGGGKFAKSTKYVEPSQKAIRQTLKQAAPSSEALKTISRGIFKELDDSGVIIKPSSYQSAVDNIRLTAKKSGLSKRTTPAAMGAIEDLEDLVGRKVPLTEINDLRESIGAVAASANKKEANLGKLMINQIDDFLDNVDEGDLLTGNIPASEIAPKYKAARNLWGRASKSEVLQDAMQKAGRRASGLENGLRVEFDKIINSKRLSKFFNEKELNIMDGLVKGDTLQNTAKLIGRFGFGEGRATNIVGGFLASLAGTAAGGVPGSIAAVTIGTAARKVAQTLTKNKAQFIDSVVRAGNNGEDITKAYLRTVPRSQRSVAQLSTLLSDPRTDISGLINSSNKLIKEAAEVAAGRQVIGEAAGILAAGAAQNQRNKRE